MTRTYMGIRFDVWNGQQAWFWLIVNGRRDAGVVGAAAGEADAIMEARRLIEEMSSKPCLLKRAAISHPAAIPLKCTRL
jgi:hypothetical protein